MAERGNIIILPYDDDVERLRKELKQTITDPRIKRFEELRGEGLDSETAADISGLTEMTVEQQLDARLAMSKLETKTPIHDAMSSASYEVPHALRQIGSATGSAVGSAIGTSMIVAATKHANTLGIILGTVGVALCSVATARFVSRASGVYWAGAAVLNIISIAGIVGRAYWKGRR